MENIKNYEEYEQLFKDDLVVSVRKLLLAIESKKDIVDSTEHNSLIEYFNRFGLHKKLNKKEVENWI